MLHSLVQRSPSGPAVSSFHSNIATQLKLHLMAVSLKSASPVAHSPTSSRRGVRLCRAATEHRSVQLRLATPFSGGASGVVSATEPGRSLLIFLRRRRDRTCNSVGDSGATVPQAAPAAGALIPCRSLLRATVA